MYAVSFRTIYHRLFFRTTAAQLAVERKKTLPFSSSVFSSRPYRSLPDLSQLDRDDDEEEQKKEKARRKMTTVESPKT